MNLLNVGNGEMKILVIHCLWERRKLTLMGKGNVRPNFKFILVIHEDREKKRLGAVEVAQLVSCLLITCQVPSFNPQLCTELGIVEHGSNTRIWKV